MNHIFLNGKNKLHDVESEMHDNFVEQHYNESKIPELDSLFTKKEFFVCVKKTKKQ